MNITDLVLQNFRSYDQKHLTFSDVTAIVGPNTTGKSNIIESIYLLASGKSFKAEKDIQMIRFGEGVARVKGKILTSTYHSPSLTPVKQASSPPKAGPLERDLSTGEEMRGKKARDQEGDETILEVVIAKQLRAGRESYLKRFLVNNVPKRRVDFISHFQALLFVPSHLDIIVGSPSLRRSFFDEVLEPVDREYRLASIQYEKALRQRNALLHDVKETGRRDEKVFEYWDSLLIQNGQILTEKREAFIAYVNLQKKELIEFSVEYDKSIISEARLREYRGAEEASGITLVGPHRDDFIVYMNNSSADPSLLAGEGPRYRRGGEGGKDASPSPSPSPLKGEEYKEGLDFRSFGSRGQQRLVVLQLKFLQLQFMEQVLGQRPVLLLDDIFSELDDKHIEVVMGIVDKQQTILTTTHEEFLPKNVTQAMRVIHLEDTEKM